MRVARWAGPWVADDPQEADRWRPRDAFATVGPVERDSVMPIQLSTDQRVVGSEALAREVDSAVRGSLGRLAERITRVADRNFKRPHEAWQGQ
jgi:hypothetical protein